MRKFLLAVALCFAAVSASAAEWYYIGDREFGTSIAASYIDKKSVNCAFDECSVEEATILYPSLKQPATTGSITINHVRMRFKFKCDTQMFTTTSGAGYYYTHLKMRTPRVKENWMKVPSGSPAEIVYNLVCKYGSFDNLTPVPSFDREFIAEEEEFLAKTHFGK